MADVCVLASTLAPDDVSESVCILWINMDRRPVMLSHQCLEMTHFIFKRLIWEERRMIDRWLETRLTKTLPYWPKRLYIWVISLRYQHQPGLFTVPNLTEHTVQNTSSHKAIHLNLIFFFQCVKWEKNVCHGIKFQNHISQKIARKIKATSNQAPFPM